MHHKSSRRAELMQEEHVYFVPLHFDLPFALHLLLAAPQDQEHCRQQVFQVALLPLQPALREP